MSNATIFFLSNFHEIFGIFTTFIKATFASYYNKTEAEIEMAIPCFAGRC